MCNVAIVQFSTSSSDWELLLIAIYLTFKLFTDFPHFVQSWKWSLYTSVFRTYSDINNFVSGLRTPHLIYDHQLISSWPNNKLFCVAQTLKWKNRTWRWISWFLGFISNLIFMYKILKDHSSTPQIHLSPILNLCLLHARCSANQKNSRFFFPLCLHFHNRDYGELR